MVDVPSLRAERSDCVETDVFEDQQTQTLVLERVEDFWLSEVRRLFACAKAVVNADGGDWGGRCGHCCLVGVRHLDLGDAWTVGALLR